MVFMSSAAATRSEEEDGGNGIWRGGVDPEDAAGRGVYLGFSCSRPRKADG